MKTQMLLLAACCVQAVQAQTSAPVALSLTSPLDYQVFQRQSLAQGKVIIEGLLDKPARSATNNPARLEARVVGRSMDHDLPGTWQSLPFDVRVRGFRGEMTLPAGGWYRLEIRLLQEGQVRMEITVDHVGVGEILLVAGQSNSANHGEGRQRPQSPLVAAFGNGRWQPAGDPEPGASGNGGSFLPALGDDLVERFKVPIGLVPLGVGSTSVREWLPKGDPIAAPPATGANAVAVGSNRWVSAGALFDRILDAQRALGPNGFRAVLWHQGESDVHQPPDREITRAQYRQYLQRVIEASRAAAGWRVPWFVAQVSYHNPDDTGSPELRAAQQSLVTDGVALPGPNTDELGAEFREKDGRGIHFNARGLRRHGELWAEHVAPWLAQQLASASAR